MVNKEVEPWMPSDEELFDTLSAGFENDVMFKACVGNAALYVDCGRKRDACDTISELILPYVGRQIRTAVEKALAERDARHKREVIEARINEAREYLFLCDSDSGWQRLATIEAELAALEVKP